MELEKWSKTILGIPCQRYKKDPEGDWEGMPASQQEIQGMESGEWEYGV